MASTLCQKLLTIFDKKHKILYGSDHTTLFKSPACGPTTYQIMYGEIVSISNGNIKCPIGKLIFALNLPLKLFRTTVVNADIGSLRSLHTFLNKCLHHMPVKFQQNRMGQTTRNFDLFDKKKRVFYNHFWQRVNVEDVSVAEIFF